MTSNDWHSYIVFNRCPLSSPLYLLLIVLFSLSRLEFFFLIFFSVITSFFFSLFSFVFSVSSHSFHPFSPLCSPILFFFSPLSSPFSSALDSPLYCPLSFRPFSVLSSTSSTPFFSSLSSFTVPPLYSTRSSPRSSPLSFRCFSSPSLCFRFFPNRFHSMCLLPFACCTLSSTVLCDPFLLFFIQNSWPEIKPNSQRIPGAYILHE